MSLREADNLADMVDQLQLKLNEVKTAQYTSQNSGMKFKIASTEFNTWIENRGEWGDLYLFTINFKPTDSPVVCIPTQVLSVPTSGASLTLTPSPYDANIYSVELYYQGEFMGAGNWLPYHHRTITSDGSYGWLSYLYMDYLNGSWPLKLDLSIKASQGGELNVRMEQFRL